MIRSTIVRLALGVALATAPVALLGCGEETKTTTPAGGTTAPAGGTTAPAGGTTAPAK